ncbi:uncharacterized protein LOC132280784 isoform X2 [Cornus florida]|uniref:uncharacterized protein LOC132280784 isoform X2 n=1 Tax=Cornus florida TaxID=4283 RepID=UPI002896DA58|nr:uncharacterized protein LOC132280784 isoform X2 [Cornus florida]
MRGKGGSCIARSEEYCANDDKFIINHIMLRYRPIAPKPAGGEVSMPENNKAVTPKRKRTERKYSTVRRSKKRATAATDCKNYEEMAAKKGSLVTLQLLPEKSVGKGILEGGSSGGLDPTGITKKTRDDQDPPICRLNSMNKNVVVGAYGGCGSDAEDLTAMRRVVESWVVVECVTETSMDGRGLGSSDMEKVMNLEVDACPALVSDGLNRVQWVNEAYKEMAMEAAGGGCMHMVWLVIERGEVFALLLPSVCMQSES